MLFIYMIICKNHTKYWNWSTVNAIWHL